MDEIKAITRNTGIAMPLDFPLKTYNEIHLYLVKYGSSKKTEHTLFSVAWNGLGYRFRAMAEHDEKYILSTIKPKPHSHEDLYIQGNEFFSFFYCGVSALDCLFFSIYNIGSLLDTVTFPVMDAKELDIKRVDVKQKFRSKFTGDTLSISLTNIIKDPMCKGFYDYRNVLSHRGLLPRNIYAGGERDGTITIPINPRESSHNWIYDLPFDKDTTSSYRLWISTKLTNILSDVEVFCKSRL